MNNRNRYLFSAALPLVFLTSFFGTGAIIIESKKDKVAPIEAETLVVPPLDITPTTVQFPMDYVLAPAPTSPPKKEIKVVKPMVKAKVVAAPPKKEKKFVCGPEWIESNYGGHYQRCEWE